MVKPTDRAYLFKCVLTIFLKIIFRNYFQKRIKTITLNLYNKRTADLLKNFERSEDL